MKFARALAAAVAVALVLSTAPDDTAAQEKKEQPPKKGFKARSWDEVVDAGVAYLKTTQAEDGAWARATHPGITGVVALGLLKSGKVAADDPLAARALTYVEGMADPKDGSLAAGDGIRHKFYVTSINAQALKAAGVKKYDPIVAKAAGYLKHGQVGADDGKGPDDVNYGGFGYGPGARGDMSNTHFALDALVAAGTPKDDPVFKRAVVFVSRCQNLPGELNKAPWAAKTNDGSFIYVLPQPGGMGDPADPRPGYGSMTFAGIKSLAQCGVGRDDPRHQRAMEWVAKNYSVDVNPGRQEGAGGQGYFYYLVAMARCLDTLGVDTVADANGKAHDWRADITRALTNRQRKDGSWGSDFPLWMESVPELDTAYALIALSYTKPKTR